MSELRSISMLGNVPESDDPATTRGCPALSIGLLGGFRVTVGDRIVQDASWRTRKARSLVKLLCLAPNHRLHREEVMDLLWPELQPEAASSNLRTTLHAARRALEPDRSAAAPSFLSLRADVLQLDTAGGLWIDVDAFEIAATAARSSEDAADYERALELYTGELLPEDRYEDWATAPREALKDTYLSLLVMLAQLYESRRNYAPAIATFERVVAADPTHEDGHVGLMRLYALTHRHAQALRQYARLREALTQELDVEPSTTSQRLHADIAAGRFPPPDAGTQQKGDGAGPNPTSQPGRRHNVPAPLTRFIGRQQDIVEIGRRLSVTRLLTLAGTGGSGKSRLALELARERVKDYADGVWFVELASLADPTLVAGAVAAVVGVREQPGRAPAETLADALQSRSLLLVLDNCEHLIEACASLIDTLLTRCPQMHILATSREALRVPGEVIWRVLSLPLPASPAQAPAMARAALERLAENEAVALFIDRVQWVRPGFVLTNENAGAVTRICQRLDGLPLALELAAARASILEPEQLSARLDDTLRVLSSGSRTAPSRQQTLRATLDWSYALLTNAEQLLLRRLAVFAGGWTLEAAEAVCGERDGQEVEDHNKNVGLGQGEVLTVLAQLVDKSLVQVEEDVGERVSVPGVRYRLLETVRQYAAERLRASGEAAPVGERHAAYFLSLAEDAEPALVGPDQVAWLGRLKQEHDNLRAALRWSVEHGDSAREALLCAALWRFWYYHGHLVEGEHWLADALARSEANAVSAFVRARALRAAGALAWNRGDLERSEELSFQALALFQEAGDAKHVAATLHTLGIVSELQGEYAKAARRYHEALRLWQELGNEPGAAHTLHNLGNLAREQGHLEQASALYDRSLALQRKSGNKRGIAIALAGLAQVALDQGDYASSAALSTQCVDLYQELGDKSLRVIALQNLGYAVLYQGDAERAMALQAQCLRVAADAGDRRGIACGLEGLGAATALRDQDVHGAERAVRLFGAADALREAMNVPLPPADRAMIERPLASVRSTLGPMAFDAAWAAGRAQPIDDLIAQAVAVAEALPAEQRTPTAETNPSSLSRREREVVVLLARGQTNAQIAAVLEISRRTTDTHVSNLLRKLGFSSRADVRVWAIEHGLLSDDGPSTS